MSELFVNKDVAVVNVACIEELKAGLLEKLVIGGVPGVFNECDGNVAESW